MSSTLLSRLIDSLLGPVSRATKLTRDADMVPVLAKGTAIRQRPHLVLVSNRPNSSLR